MEPNAVRSRSASVSNARVAWAITALFALQALAIVGAPAQAAAPVVGWGTPVLVEHDNAGQAEAPLVAVDAQGGALAVWPMYNRIWASHFDPTGGWSAPEVISTNATGVAKYPYVAVNAQGHGFATWTQRRNLAAYEEAWANEYRPGIGWSKATNLSDDSVGWTWQSRVSVAPGGDAMAVFDRGYSYGSIYAARFTAARGWEEPVLIEQESGHALDAEVVMDESGNAVAVWDQQIPGGGITSIKFAAYTAGVGWSPEDFVELDDTTDNFGPHLAPLAKGGAVAVWVQSPWPVQHMWAAVYDGQGAWGSAEVLDRIDNHAVYPRVASDGSRGAVAVWQEENLTDATAIVVADRLVDGSWQGPETVGAGTTESGCYNCLSPRVAMDAGGEAFAVWARLTGAFREIKAARYTPGGGWQQDEPVETTNVGDAFYAEVGMDAAGNAVAVWRESDRNNWNIRANTYTILDVTPPVLGLYEPADGSNTTLPAVHVLGWSEPGATVTVNDVVAGVDRNGLFAVTIALVPGNNSILLVARDATGNTVLALVRVEFIDPTVALEEQLAQAQAAAEAAQAGADAAMAAAETAGANATAAQENATIAAEHVAEAEAALARAESEIQHGATVSAEQNATIAQLRLQLVTTNATLNETRAAVAAGGGGSASAQSPLALILGLVGAGLGAAGLVVALMARGGKGGGGGGGDGRIAMKPEGDLKRLEPGVGTGPAVGDVPDYTVKK